MASAAERFTALARRVQEEATRTLPTMEEVYREASEEDYDRAERLTRDQSDMLVTVGRQVNNINDLVFSAWDFFKIDRALWDASAQSRNQLAIVLRILRSCTWAWHQRVRAVLSPEREKVRAIVFSGSWHAFMSSTLLVHSLEANIRDRGVRIRRMPLLFTECVQDNSFVRHLLMAKRASIVVSRDAVGDYNVSDWKATLDGLWESICRFGLTPSAARLYEAFVLRYAAWFVHDDDDYEYKNDNELASIFSHWTLTREPPTAVANEGGEEEEEVREDDPYAGPLAQDAQGLAPMLHDDVLPMNPYLRLSFVIQGEMALFSGIRHINTMRAFTTHRLARPLVMSSSWRRRTAKALVELATSVLRRPSIASEITETIKSLLMRRHLRPGDAEQAMFEAGSRIGLAVEGDEVMYDIRRSEYNRVSKDVLPMDASELLTQWLHALESSMALPFSQAASDAEWDAIAAQRPIGERTAFLILETALDTLLRLHRVIPERCSLQKFGYPDDAGLVPPLDAPPPTPEEACRAVAQSGLQESAPLFVAIAHTYCVIVGPDKRILYTPHLVDALGAWLGVCYERQLLPTRPAEMKPLRSLLTDAALVAQWV